MISPVQILDYVAHLAATLACYRKGHRQAGWALLQLLVLDIALFGLSQYLAGYPKPYPVGLPRGLFLLFTTLYMLPPVILVSAFPRRTTDWIAHGIWIFTSVNVCFRYPQLRGKDLWYWEMWTLAGGYLMGIIAALREIIGQRLTLEGQILLALVMQGVMGLALSLVLGIELWWMVSAANITVYVMICVLASREDSSRSVR